MKKGLAASDGIGIGKTFRADSHLNNTVEYIVGDIDKEIARFEQAVASFVTDTEKKIERVKTNNAPEQANLQADVLSGRIVMISDPYLIGEVTNAIKSGQSALIAVQKALEVFEKMFASSDDPYMAERAADVRELSQAIVNKLKGIQEPDLSNLPNGTVLVAYEITASMLADIAGSDSVVALLGTIGGFTSHCSILARNMGLPAVFEIELDDIKDGTTVIVDGGKGEVFLSPDKKNVETYTAQYNAKLELEKKMQAYKSKPTTLKSGEHTHVYCNIGNTSDAKAAFESSAEGVGLFRTEFLYMQYTTAPSEEMQFLAYKTAATSLNGLPVIIRTLDVGGDKDIPYLNLPKEENPFLGFRAIRYCLTRTDIFEVQIRAILRASAFGKIKIMLPMISDVSEVRKSKILIEKVKKDLDKDKIEYDKNIQVGIMTETAASALIADVLAKEVDFFSIGTNDLTQYVMSADRGNADVAHLCSVFYPAVLRAIKSIILAAKKAKIEVAMCGEAAADQLMLPLLLSWGLDEFSVGAKSVLKVRAGIAQWDKVETDKVEKHAMGLATTDEIKDYLKSVVKVLG
ncbi:MAG: phosphoenolpyruvate--protein phosphotransferase [Firmicutes bacterium]|nr:phosphoenolpyruvate--protein phosphotransferase [Bacillota bacterium]